jgi:hypothetical protein
MALPELGRVPAPKHLGELARSLLLPRPFGPW